MLIPEAIKEITGIKINDLLVFTDIESFNSERENHRYFNAYEYHCKHELDGKFDADSYILKQFTKVVQVWDNRNKIGYIITPEIYKKYFL